MVGRRRSQSAFTLLEIVVVIGIIAVLASFLMPAIAEVRVAAKITASKGNLRQIYIGTMLYRDQVGSTTEFGEASAMGLPWLVSRSQAIADSIAPRAVWQSPCCCHKDGFKNEILSYSEIMHTEEFWESYVAEQEGSTILFFDAHCNDQATDLYRPRGRTVRLVGVRLNGAVESRVRRTRLSALDSFWRN